MGTQLWILGCHTYRAGVGVAFAHHHAAEHDEYRCAEAELLSTEECHTDDVVSGLELTVGLQTHLAAQAVAHEGLLGFAQTDFRRDAGVAHRRCRRCSCAAFCARNHNQVGFRFSHTGGDCADTALCHEFHANLCLRIDVLEVEYQLREVLDGVDVVVRWRRNQRDAGDGVTRACNHLIDLESWQLAAFSRLRSLCHLYLYLFGVDQVFGGNAKAS